jgi:hypothetical protein
VLVQTKKFYPRGCKSIDRIYAEEELITKKERKKKKRD